MKQFDGGTWSSLDRVGGSRGLGSLGLNVSPAFALTADGRPIVTWVSDDLTPPTRIITAWSGSAWIDFPSLFVPDVERVSLAADRTGNPVVA